MFKAEYQTGSARHRRMETSISELSEEVVAGQCQTKRQSDRIDALELAARRAENERRMLTNFMFRIEQGRRREACSKEQVQQTLEQRVALVEDRFAALVEDRFAALVEDRFAAHQRQQEEEMRSMKAHFVTLMEDRFAACQCTKEEEMRSMEDAFDARMEAQDRTLTRIQGGLDVLQQKDRRTTFLLQLAHVSKQLEIDIIDVLLPTKCAQLWRVYSLKNLVPLFDKDGRKAAKCLANLQHGRSCAVITSMNDSFTDLRHRAHALRMFFDRIQQAGAAGAALRMETNAIAHPSAQVTCDQMANMIELHGDASMKEAFHTLWGVRDAVVNHLRCHGRPRHQPFAGAHAP